MLISLPSLFRPRFLFVASSFLVIAAALPWLTSFATPAGPQISSISPSSVQRSGLITIHGANFGAQQNSSVLRIDGKVSPFVAYWTDTYILAHVPETASLGSVSVEVSTTDGFASTTVTVTTRQPLERIRWRAEAVGDYILGLPAVAPPGVPGAGTIYAATNAGFLYAWAPNGALRWAVPGASGDDPVSVGPDGTIYTSSQESNGNGEVGPAVNAFNPDGTRKWTFIDIGSQTVRAGPSVGPDGKIYVVFRPLTDVNGNFLGLNLAALRPDGTLAWSVNRNFHRYGSDGKELTFGRQLRHVYFGFDVDPDPGPGFVNGGIFAYDFDGRLVWEKPGGCCGIMAVPPDEGIRHGASRLNPLTGDVVYTFNFPPYGATPYGPPAAGPDNIHYIKGNARLFALNPNGTEKWRYEPVNPDGSFVTTTSPAVNSTNTAILLGGGGAFGQQTLFLSVDPSNGREQWRQHLPEEQLYPPYGNIFLAMRAVFSADGNTGYVAGDINGDQDIPFQQKFCYFYALNTGPDNLPTNQPPQVSITSPTEGFTFAKNTPTTVTAGVQDDGAVTQVEFYYNLRGTTHFLSTDTTAPYSAVFQAAEPDVYGLYAVATDAGGLIAQSPVRGVIVTNETPTISWVSPSSGNSFVRPATVVLTARASDSDGTISHVEFNSSLLGLIGRDTTAGADGNYSVDFVNPPEGTHELSAWATDNNGYRQNAIITIMINPAPTPTPSPTPTATPVPTATPTPTPTTPGSRKRAPGKLRRTSDDLVAPTVSDQATTTDQIVLRPLGVIVSSPSVTKSHKVSGKPRSSKTKCKPGTVFRGKRCEPVARK